MAVATGNVTRKIAALDHEPPGRPPDPTGTMPGMIRERGMYDWQMARRPL